MESKLKPSALVAISVLLALSSFPNKVNAKPEVPCYFIFGDSLSDNGNNNNLETLAKVNYPPYGIDFPQGPTGRFSNGRNMQDFIVKRLGIEDYMPPFAKLGRKNISNGVNYASGSSGILDESGKHLGARIPLIQQIKNHKTIISMLTRLTRNDSTMNSLLSQCIYSVQIGSNDYLNNYFNPEFYNSSRLYTLPEYATLLVQKLSLQLKALYDHGARKFAVYGIGEIGCTPYAISVYGTNGSDCVVKLNEGATYFNDRLKPLVNQLNKNLTDAKVTYLNPSGSPAGFVTNGLCCKIGGGGGELCLRNSKPCNKPRRYVFWDGVHPAEAWNQIIAESAYSSKSPLEASPFNIQQLAEK
ncbi:GDSL-like Lipase/Acylhydrolase superfamily protein, putative isoform 2 [Hibiscus syriacus]|uniref:GDSL-like Lipase/Acylhydrolase superfamily protein, putative isoform 2 n=1 Tax=Hibiscus syriacus TaxID=106335 RepID=A0A6A2WKR6_HIBSY|nr:GDSL esterase/lipase At1g29660-like [Hibiscus syriacus]KAE8660283.1 GDSL-like Lipase/Acylhydrolase superfamily protein, putative isoform 2 [Hibiscus syriacus]